MWLFLIGNNYVGTNSTSLQPVTAIPVVHLLVEQLLG